MRVNTIVLGVVGAGLVGAGVWIARASSAPAPAPVVAPPPIVVAPPPPRSARPAMPALPHRTVAPGLAADLHDADPHIRRAAIVEVARDHDADPEALLVASRDADLEVATMATTALGKRYAEGSVPASAMVERVTDHKLAEKVRIGAMNGLGLVPSAEAVALLEDRLAHGDVVERRSAAILLVHQDAEAAIPALIDALTDADEYVRSNALASLRAASRGRDLGTDPGPWRTWWQSRRP